MNTQSLAHDRAEPKPVAGQTIEIIRVVDSAVTKDSPAGHPSPVAAGANSTLTAASEVADLSQVLRLALADSRNAAGLLQDMLQVASGISASTTEAKMEPLVQAADQLAAGAEAVTSLAMSLLERGLELQAAAARLKPAPAVRLAAAIEALQAHKRDHQEMVRRAEQLLKGGQELGARNMVAASHCALGQWCQGEGRANWGLVPALAAIEQPHVAWHRTLAALLFAHQQGRQAATDSLLNELHCVQNMLDAALDTLICHIEEAAQHSQTQAPSWARLERNVLFATPLGRVARPKLPVR